MARNGEKWRELDLGLKSGRVCIDFGYKDGGGL
jgi:hypothetical protein